MHGHSKVQSVWEARSCDNLDVFACKKLTKTKIRSSHEVTEHNKPPLHASVLIRINLETELCSNLTCQSVFTIVVLSHPTFTFNR